MEWETIRIISTDLMSVYPTGQVFQLLWNSDKEKVNQEKKRLIRFFFLNVFEIRTKIYNLNYLKLYANFGG